MMLAEDALRFAVSVDPKTVLDFGAGPLLHSKHFLDAGAVVTAVDLRSPEFEHPNLRYCQCLFDDFDTEETFDLVWCSHVLEHAHNVGLFLIKILKYVGEDGWLVLTVPPWKHEIVGGHVSFWNPGLMMYRLVLAGQDCSEAKVLQSGYNCTVAVRKKPIVVPPLGHDVGDIEVLAEFFPPGCRTQGFNGNIEKLNWDEQ